MCFGNVKTKELLGLSNAKTRYNRNLRTDNSTEAASEITVIRENTLVEAIPRTLQSEITEPPAGVFWRREPTPAGQCSSAGYSENSVNRIIERAKGIYRSRKMRIFALLVVILLVPIWILKSLLPGSAGDYQITEIRFQGNTLLLLALNDHGQVAGSIGGPGKGRAVIWDADDVLTHLATPKGYSSLAMDINNAGQVCGTLRDPNNIRRACFWDSDGRMYDIGTLGGRVSAAQRLNNNGQVVGLSQTSNNTTHTFLWSKERGIVGLDTPGSGHSYPLGINKNGQVVGELSTSGGKRHAFVWQEETGMVDIHDRLRGTESVASGINDAGQIIGQYMTGNNLSRAFVWDRNRGFTYLKIASDGEWACSPLAITDRGHGLAMMRHRRIKKFGFVIRQESNLPLLLDHKLRRRYLHKALPFETTRCTAYDINNRGQIIVLARKSRSMRWYLMTPVDSAHRSARKSE